AAIAWVTLYSLATYSLGAAFADLAAPVAAVLGAVAILIILAVPTLVLRYEQDLLAKAESELPSPSVGPPAGKRVSAERSFPAACRGRRSRTFRMTVAAPGRRSVRAGSASGGRGACICPEPPVRASSPPRTGSCLAPCRCGCRRGRCEYRPR